MRGRPGPKWTVRINVAREAAFDYVADFLRHPDWAMDNMYIAPDRPGPLEVGSRFQAEGTLFGKRNASTVTVTEIDRPSRLEFEAQDGQGVTGHVFTFDTDGATTVVSR